MRIVILSGLAMLMLGAGVLLFASGEPGASPAYAELKRSYRATSVPPPHQDMEVATAYRAIPHQRTPFRLEDSGMPADEARYLEDLFALTDAGVVERVTVQRTLMSGGTWVAEASNYEAILSAIASLDTPDHLLSVEALIFDSITEQRRYLEGWQRSGEASYFNRRDPLVGSSHRKLIQAYKRLMKLYPAEGGHNRQAFFDHLCALDFI